MNNLLQPLQSLFPHDYHDRIYLVGGSVRDYLLNRKQQDYDLVTAVSAELLKSCGFRLIAGKTTAPIWFRFVDPLGKVEVIQLDDTTQLEDDLWRRDFTINAIAVSLAGQLYDPLNGSSDLHRRLLRACSGQSFQDDPLRMFRAFRFEADCWRMTPETEKLIQHQDWTVMLAALPVERFSRELVKALAASQPERFFERMIELKVGRDWLPELFRMQDIPAGPLEHHPEGDLLTHAIQVMQRASFETSDPLTRFCAFLHDIGKLSTDPALYPKHHKHEEAGFTPALEMCRRLCLPTSWGKALAWTSRLHTHLNRWYELRDATKLRVAVQAQKACISEILPIVSVADKSGNGVPVEWQNAITIAGMNSKQLGIEKSWLEAIPAAQRSGIILQKRIEQYRSTA